MCTAKHEQVSTSVRDLRFHWSKAQETSELANSCHEYLIADITLLRIQLSLRSDLLQEAVTYRVKMEVKLY